MTTLQPLHDLAAQWRKRADESNALSLVTIEELWTLDPDDPLVKVKLVDKATCRAEARVYQNAADDLERELRRIDEPDAE